MNRWMDRMKNGLRRVGDFIGGHDHDVAIQSPPPELLDGRDTVRPRCDVWESDREIVVVADVPGACPDTTAVSCDDGELVLAARSDVAETYHARFTIPRDVDAAAVRASLRDGVLEVRLPKRPRSPARRIPVVAS